jgi:hypothetical protein
MTLFSLKSFLLISAGPQKPQKLTASKIRYEQFGQKKIKILFTSKITLISMVKTMLLTFLDGKK